MLAIYINRFKNWLWNGVFAILFIILAFGFYAVCNTLAWFALCGLRFITEYLFIPYPSGSYIHLGGMLNEFPWSILALFGVAMFDPPNSLFLFLWSLIISVLILSFPSNWSDLPAKMKKGKTRKELRNNLLLKCLKGFIGSAAFVFVLCLPGARCYQIITNSEIRYVDYFSRVEMRLPLTDLKYIERYIYGRGHISWRLLFEDGKDGITIEIDAPSRQALEKLLTIPQVTSNVFLRDGKLFLKKT